MKSSVSFWSYQKMIQSEQISLIEVLRLLEEMQVDQVELLSDFMKDDETHRQVSSFLKNSPLTVSSYSASNNFVAEEAERKANIAKIKEAVDIAKTYDTDVVRVFCANATDKYTYEQGIAMIVDSFKECTSYAEQKDVTLALENHGMFAGKSQQVLDILDAVGSPALKATTDTGNFLLVCDDPVQAVSKLAKRVALVHFKDFKKSDTGYAAIDGQKYEGTIIGQGEVDLPKIVSILKENGYNGALSIEYEGTDDDNVQAVKESVQYLKSLL